MNDNGNDPASALSYRGSISGLKGLLSNKLTEGIASVVENLEKFSDVASQDEAGNLGSTRLIPVEKIMPCPSQPRQVFDAQSLEQLSLTMKEMGQAQAITVRPMGDKFEIISGERRYRAAKLAGITQLHCLIKDVDNKEADLLSLVENLQRKDLLPIEEAAFLKKVLGEYGDLSLEKLARMLGTHKSTLSEKVKMADIPADVQKMLYERGYSFTHRHWRVLSRIEDQALLKQMCLRALDEKLSVTELERSLEAFGVKKKRRSKPAEQLNDSQLSFESFSIVEHKDDRLRVKSFSADLKSLTDAARQKIVSELEKALEALRA